MDVRLLVLIALYTYDADDSLFEQRRRQKSRRPSGYAPTPMGPVDLGEQLQWVLRAVEILKVLKFIKG